MNAILSAPKTDTYHFRINPEVRAQVEEVYAKSGLSFTQAINVFIQQSLDAGGFPFAVNTENAELLKAESMKRLMKELEAGENSGELVDEADVYKMFDVEAI